MSNSLDLNQITQQAEGERNAQWERIFFQALGHGCVDVESGRPEMGPDDWPYLHVKTNVEAQEPTSRLVDWLTQQGIGLVVNAHKEVPDYVFTYGMLWNFRERGEFLTESAEIQSGPFEYNKGQKVLAGEPSKEYLPSYVRQILAQFFKDQGIDRPRILVLSQDQKQFDLLISLESLGSPQTNEHQGIAEAIAWFLPAHYSIVLASEESLPAFTDLVQPEVTI